MHKPLISIIVPCRNEIAHIEKCVRSLANQKEMSEKLEIIIVDGQSDDGTIEKLEELKKQFNYLKVLNNEKRITPVALNLGINEASGDYICIFGAHSEYAEDYLINAMKLMVEHPEADCVGGPILSKGRSRFGEGAAIAMSNIIGVGNAKHRFEDYEGYAEMACFPVFRKEIFKKIGMYDEALVNNQDDELCFRLTRSGRKVYLSPTVKSIYYVRDSPSLLFKQYFNYGKWRIAVLKKHNLPISLRQFVPTLFYLMVLFSLILAVISKLYWIALILPGSYLIIITLFSFKIAFRKGVRIIPAFWFSVVILHAAYAFGFIVGLFKFRLWSKKLNFNFI